MADLREMLFLISSGSCFTQGRVPSAGYRLFDGNDIYVYRATGALWVSRDVGSSWTNIIPSGMGYVSTIAQTYDGTDTFTYITAANTAKYQKYPETSTWSSGSVLPTGFYSEDSAADQVGDIGILIGNIHRGTEARIVLSPSTPPFPVAKSDTGIPQTGLDIALITDIEICE